MACKWLVQPDPCTFGPGRMPMFKARTTLDVYPVWLVGGWELSSIFLRTGGDFRLVWLIWLYKFVWILMVSLCSDIKVSNMYGVADTRYSATRYWEKTSKITAAMLHPFWILGASEYPLRAFQNLVWHELNTRWSEPESLSAHQWLIITVYHSSWVTGATSDAHIILFLNPSVHMSQRCPCVRSYAVQCLGRITSSPHTLSQLDSLRQHGLCLPNKVEGLLSFYSIREKFCLTSC
jgi:hypothetical protein